MPHPRLSLIVAVYNKPLLLQYVFAALDRQSFTEFEVIVADDGSGPEIRGVIEEAKRAHRFPITHLWHEDRGWRKNIMLNNAIRAAQTDWMVFTDGDCLPSTHFLLDHFTERNENTMLMGRRVETSERWARALTIDKIRSGEFERYGLKEWMDGLRGRSLRVEDGIRIPSRLLRTILLRKVRGMLGCNFSIAKRDLEGINGFDELYDGPGCGEDSDVQYRLSLNGIIGKSMRNLAIQYHVWHPRQPVSDASWNRLQEVQRRAKAVCTNGLRHIVEQ